MANPDGNNVKEILEFISTQAAAGNWGTLIGGLFFMLFVLLFAALLWKGPKLLEFILQLKNHREQALVKALNITNLSLATRQVTCEEIDRLIFLKATRLSRKRAERETIALLCARSGGDLHSSDFRKAGSQCQFIDGRYAIPLGWPARIGNGANYVFAGIFFFTFAFSFIGLLIFSKLSVQQSLGLGVAGILYFIGSVYMLLQTIPYTVAKRIKPHVEKLQEDGSIRTVVLALLAQPLPDKKPTKRQDGGKKKNKKKNADKDQNTGKDKDGDKDEG